MKTVTQEEITIVGIEIRTTNENGKAAQDIPALWQRFMQENIKAQIPNRLGDTLYALYTDYESDYNKPYTTIIGCSVSSLDAIPEHLTVKIIPRSTYVKFEAKGNLIQNAVIDTWMQIWQSDLKRAYTTDLEVYDERALDLTNGVADILIAV